MAKVTAPILSFGASGAVAKSQVYASWKGIKYARQHVVPANPRTSEQMVTRNLFAMLSKFWTIAPTDMLSSWNAQASGQKYTGRNHFMGMNVKALRGQADMADFIGSPGNLSAFPAATFAAVNDASTDVIHCTFTLQTLPTGWTATEVVAVAFGDTDDPTTWVPTVLSGNSAPPTLTFDITGLPHDQDNVVSGWVKYTRPDAKIAYGPSLTVIAAAT